MGSRFRRIEGEEIRQIRDVPKGEYIRVLRADGTPMKRVYIRDEYDQQAKAFILLAADDICQYRTLKADRKVLVGFTY